MDLDLDRLNDDLNCTDEKVTCLDMWDNILVATKTGVVFEKVSPKESTKISEREKLVEKYGWRRLKSFGSWKVVQVCCSDNHQILLTSTKEVFSWVGQHFLTKILFLIFSGLWRLRPVRSW